MHAPRIGQIVRAGKSFVLAVVLVLSFVSVCQARMASIETTALVRDYSPESVAIAIQEAVDVAVQGAVAMGLPWIEVYEARVMTDMVVVRILATDESLGGEGEDEQAELGEGPGAGIGHPPRRDF